MTSDVKEVRTFDTRLRITLAFVVTFGILILCIGLGLFLWRERLEEKFARLDLYLAPLGLLLGLAVGTVTGRWRFRALKELSKQLGGITLWREKTVLPRSAFGRKALKLEGQSYAALFYIFLVVWGVSLGYFMPVGTAAFFVFGVWVAGQAIPYFRFWLWQHSSHAEMNSDVSHELVLVPAGEFREHEDERVKARRQGEPRNLLDPRPRIVLTLVGLIPCLTIAWFLWKGQPLDASRPFELTFLLVGLAAGLAVGQSIGRWRFWALQRVSTQLAGRILFHEPDTFSRSDFGKKAIRTEKLVIASAGFSGIAWAAFSNTPFLPIEILIYFLMGLLLAGQTIPYFRLWRSQGSERGQ